MIFRAYARTYSTMHNSKRKLIPFKSSVLTSIVVAFITMTTTNTIYATNFYIVNDERETLYLFARKYMYIIWHL